MKPLCTVVITCYNDGAWLVPAIESVQKSSTPCEIIVVDDCSTDTPTREILKQLATSHKIIFLDQNKGVGNARNKGFEQASTAYILPLDGDDLLEVDFIENAILFLEKNTQFGVVYGNVQKFGTENKLVEVPEFEGACLLAGNFIANTSLIKKSDWEKTSGYDTNLPNYEDWEMWIKLYEKGVGFKKINQIAFQYRIKATSKVSKVKDPAHRKKVVQYICDQHPAIYKGNCTAIVPFLHQVISSNEQDLNTLKKLDHGDLFSITEKVKSLEIQLKEQKSYYENSFFWKLKKLVQFYKN